MNTTEELCTWIVPPNVVVSMCGVKYARKFASGKVILTYIDGSEESTILQTSEYDTENFFSIVSAVQSKR